ncbi:MAG TPA: PAS domain-containing protein, partial [Ktedonobacteraceae bacterium]|nr:PAS domain-containing protein [Ktedonobacteraceae bacterium]
MNRDSDELAQSASEEYPYSGYASAVTLPPQREALTARDYRVLFEVLPQGIVCQDRAGRIVMANPAAQQMLGLSLDQLRGRTVFDKSWQLIREDGLPFPISDHPAIQALHSGEPAPSMLMGIFNPREHAYRWVQVSAVPQIRPGEDAPSLIYTVFHDQTQHKERQDLLRASEHRARMRVVELETIFQTIAEYVVIYDRYGHVLQMSEGIHKLLGVEPTSGFMQQSLHDRSASVSICGEDGCPLPTEQWPVRRILNGEVLRNATAFDFIVRRPDGSDCQISVNGAPMLDAAGQITGAVAIFQDVTERRNLERRTQRSLEALLAMVEAMVRAQQESELPDDEDLAVSGAPQTTLETQPTPDLRR